MGENVENAGIGRVLNGPKRDRRFSAILLHKSLVSNDLRRIFHDAPYRTREKSLLYLLYNTR